MAFPALIAAAVPSFVSTAVGVVVAGVIGALVSRAGSILIALGLTYMSVTGLSTLIGFLVSDINTAIAGYNAYAGSGTGGLGIGTKMLKMAAYVGLFDAINITLSAASAAFGVVQLKVFLARVRG